ncbi:alpha/beta hydrolase [Cohnella silvisoli]|uniref:Alpha/beta fold hydrolase n=1 Tax=Cohnella silvisoli TaxID=2873699 RepID=A0ABV1KLS4_9BACL|nr:alpha/beta fold hydrolase [Cohnella silvisoli]MCD9020896.1 alpha/beta fold hydrolase [Cohnella silvisoli]
MSFAMIGWMVGGVGALAGGAGAALYGLTVKAQKPRLLPNETEPSVPYETVEWKSAGKTVRGWFLSRADADVGPGPVIIIAHGWGSNRSRVLRYALPLYEEGYSILMYDARSHGESEYYKTPTGLQFRDDLLAAFEWLRTRPEADPSRIGVLGHSLGAFGAVLALDAQAPIAALVTDSMPVRFATMIGAELKRRKLPQFPLAQLLPRMMVWRSGISRAIMKKANPARILTDNARNGQTPVLLVHSRKDKFIPPTELNHVLSRTPDLPHLFVDAEGHSSSERDPTFWPAVKSFFRNELQKK